MPFPIQPEKHTLQPFLSAADMIDFRRRQGGLARFAAPRTVILCLYKGVMQHFWLRYRSTRVNSFLGDLYLLHQRQGQVGVMGNFGIGSPVVASLADELAAWGCKRLVLLSLAGGLQPNLKPGTVVICNSAVRDEGASYHYLSPAKYVSASTTFVDSLMQTFTQQALGPKVGATWSTDAPYRESREEVIQLQGEGVQTVDMESAGLFAVGQARQIETASVFVVGDSLAAAQWAPPPDMRPLHQKLKVVLKTLVESV